jgi:hypothetical protein
MRSWEDNEEEGERGGQEEERKRALEKHSSISREQQPRGQKRARIILLICITMEMQRWE